MLNPGASEQYKFTLAFKDGVGTEVNGLQIELQADFVARQWNAPEDEGWVIECPLDMTIIINEPPATTSAVVISAALTSSLANAGVTYAQVGGSLPQTVVGGDTTTITITHWGYGHDGSYTGFRFTVQGDPVAFERHPIAELVGGHSLRV